MKQIGRVALDTVVILISCFVRFHKISLELETCIDQKQNLLSLMAEQIF